jgi:hypothetical protein
MIVNYDIWQYMYDIIHCKRQEKANGLSKSVAGWNVPVSFVG